MRSPLWLRLRLKVGKSASAIAISPDGQTAYLPNHGISGAGDTVSTIRLAVGKPGGRIKVGADPDTMAITPNGRTAYVVNYLGNSLTPITLVTNKPEPRLKVSKANAIVIAPDGRTAWVRSGSGTKLVPIRIR